MIPASTLVNVKGVAHATPLIRGRRPSLHSASPSAGAPLPTAQVGKGLIDLNSAAEKDLPALPHMTPAIVKGLLEKRPFASDRRGQRLPGLPVIDVRRSWPSSIARRSST